MSKKLSFFRMSKIVGVAALIILSTIAHADQIVSGVLPSPLKEGVGVTQTDMISNSDSDTEHSLSSVEIKKIRAKAIDTYYSDRSMPLSGYGSTMVDTAEKYGLDWRLIPAISLRESTGGKFACKGATFNPFGWGSCRKKFSFRSYEHAIEVIGKNLGGENPVTAMHYDNKTVRQVLQSYNPPSVIPKYADEVMSFMDKISLYAPLEYR